MNSAKTRRIVYTAFVGALTLLLAKMTRFPPFPTACATAARVAAAIPLNLVILPLQYGTPISGVWAQMGILLPFNALKCLLDAACIMVLTPYLKLPLTKLFAPLYNKN